MQTIFKNILQKIINTNNILLVAHEKPDIDTSSSVCALKELLNSLHKNTTIYCLDKIPHQFNFLPHINLVINKILNINDFDLIITCDCGNFQKTGLKQLITNLPTQPYIINFDHHPKTDNYADIEIKDTEAVATTEIIYNFFKANNIFINKNMAECILAGIITDTKNFLYTGPNTNALKIAAKMLRAGADWSKIMQNIYFNKNSYALKLWGETMKKIELNKKYQITSTNINFNKLNKIDEEHYEGLPGLLSTIRNIKGAIFLREQTNGRIRGSLRSFDKSINMSLLASSLGGGGHVKAAGFNTKGQLIKLEKKWAIIDNNV